MPKCFPFFVSLFALSVGYIGCAAQAQFSSDDCTASMMLLEILLGVEHINGYWEYRMNRVSMSSFWMCIWKWKHETDDFIHPGKKERKGHHNELCQRLNQNKNRIFEKLLDYLFLLLTVLLNVFKWERKPRKIPQTKMETKIKRKTSSAVSYFWPHQIKPCTVGGRESFEKWMKWITFELDDSFCFIFCFRFFWNSPLKLLNAFILIMRVHIIFRMELNLKALKDTLDWTVGLKFQPKITMHTNKSKVSIRPATPKNGHWMEKKGKMSE